ncbi:hypothetical protein ANO11243_043050 [Dothideomycetidae sp. 11243]|nr:hypothetical protein ANO11243_043050 [fungal sp. No.11243]
MHGGSFGSVFGPRHGTSPAIGSLSNRRMRINVSRCGAGYMQTLQATQIRLRPTTWTAGAEVEGGESSSKALRYHSQGRGVRDERVGGLDLQFDGSNLMTPFLPTGPLFRFADATAHGPEVDRRAPTSNLSEGTPWPVDGDHHALGIQGKLPEQLLRANSGACDAKCGKRTKATSKATRGVLVPLFSFAPEGSENGRPCSGRQYVLDDHS